MASIRDNAEFWRKFNKSEIDYCLDAKPSTRHNLDTVVVGGKYEVESPHDVWVFTVTEVLPRCVIIQYEFNGGRRTMTLDRNEYHYLILNKL